MESGVLLVVCFGALVFFTVMLGLTLMKKRRAAPSIFQQREPVLSFSQRSQPVATTQKQPEKKQSPLLVLSVMAREPGAKFASYELLQAISAAGLQFGDMNIFHYYDSENGGIQPLFSLVSASKPGDFNLDQMGDFCCPGLMLFMNPANVNDVRKTFELMFETAERLAEDLDGEVRADPVTPWNNKMASQYQQKIDYFQAAYHSA